MLNSYLKTTLRHLWKNRLFTSLNIVGLAVSISACWVIYGIVSYEFSFDKKIPDRAHIYRVLSRFKYEGDESGNAGVPEPLAKAVKEQVPGVAEAVPVWTRWKTVSRVSTVNSKGALLKFDAPDDQVSTTQSYFTLVSYRWLAGAAASALNAPDAVVLTRSRAEKYFPGLSPAAVLGKTIVYNDTIPVKVSGVVADLGYPSSFPWNEMFGLSEKKISSGNWNGVSSNTTLFLRLQENAKPANVVKAINEISGKRAAEMMKKYHFQRWHTLIPLDEVHFSSEYGENKVQKANKKVLYGLMGIAAFLLLLACINYINLTTAQVPQRAKEIGIRKTLGSSRWYLIRQFLLETVAITLLSVAVAFSLSRMAVSLFSNMMPAGMDLYADYTRIIVFLVLLIVTVTLLAGWYPGWLITRVQPVNIMRGKAAGKSGKKGLLLRKNLIVFQFTIAQLFIIGAVIMGRQLHYLLNKDLGFNKEAVVMVDVPWKITIDSTYRNRQFVMQQALQQLPGVEAVAMGQAPMSSSFNSDMFQRVNDQGKMFEIQLYMKYVDTGMLALYDIPLLAGRNIAASDTVREVVINEAAVKAFGFASPEAAVGGTIKETEGKTLPVVGVVRDFHTGSFNYKIEATALMSEKASLTTFNMKLHASRPGEWQQVLKQVEGIWKKNYPEAPFAYSFYDTKLKELYEAELNTGRIINVATAICIIISCLGLFGLSTLTAWQRVKEIGIRKVLGASVAGIVRMLSFDFIKLVLIAIVIASPIAWWAMHQWLQHFAYRVSISWWMFLAAGVAALLIALLTMSFQAIKAAVVKPVKSLRSE